MRRKHASIFLVIWLLFTIVTPALAANFNDVKNSTVRIRVEHYVTIEGQRIYVGWGQGSGFAVAEKNGPVSYFVTNRHVVEPSKVEIAEGVWVDSDYWEYYVVFDNYTNKVPASLVSITYRADLAVLKLNTPTTERKPVRIRPFSSLEGGEKVYAIGFPGISSFFLKDDAQSQLYSTTNDMSVNTGTVGRVLDSAKSAVGELIQMDVSINHGNSGGPLVDENGNVLGVNTYGITEDESGIVQGMNYAVSSNEVIRFLNAEGIPFIEAGGFALDPWLIGIIVVVLASAVVLVFIVLQMKKTKSQNAARDKKAGHGATRKLVAADGPLAGKQYTISRKVSIGRDSKKCQIAFPKDTPAVSALHCTVRFDGARVTVTDEGSTYGTKINETKLPKGVPTTMHRGQKLYIGSDKNGFTLQ